MMYTILRKRLIDSVLAESALRGDITGRGSMLVDNDGVALGRLLDDMVPAALDNYGISYSRTRMGWRIDNDDFTREQIMDYLRALFVNSFSDADPNVVGRVDVFPDDLWIEGVS